MRQQQQQQRAGRDMHTPVFSVTMTTIGHAWVNRWHCTSNHYIVVS